MLISVRLLQCDATIRTCVRGHRCSYSETTSYAFANEIDGLKRDVDRIGDFDQYRSPPLGPFVASDLARSSFVAAGFTHLRKNLAVVDRHQIDTNMAIDATK